MRILMLTASHLLPDPDAPQIGGAVRQCMVLAKALVRQNINVSVVASSVSRQDPTRQTIDGVPVVLLGVWRSTFNRKGLRRLENYVFLLLALSYLYRHRDEYDVIHAHSALVSGFAGVFAGKWLNKKSIIKVMNSGIRNDILRFRQAKAIWGSRAMADYLVNCDCAITLNQLAYEQLAAMGFRKDQLALIPNGVEVARFQAKTCYDSNDAIHIIYVGRLAQTKNLGVLLEAFRLVNARTPHPDCRLTILGRGKLRPHLEAMTDAMGLTDHVHFAGEVTDVAPYLAHSDIFVLPSRAEGISNALLEAMATGLPCIATNIPGNDTVLHHEANGLLAEVDNSEALAESIHRLATDRELRRQLGRAARKTVEDRFDSAAIAKRYIDLYQRLLQTQ